MIRKQGWFFWPFLLLALGALVAGISLGSWLFDPVPVVVMVVMVVVAAPVLFVFGRAGFRAGMRSGKARNESDQHVDEGENDGV